jgi:hypothetical protein
MPRWITGPIGLALIVTLANMAKPVVVDDTAYLAYARHMAQDPLDPYGFEIFWYAAPEPAIGVLAPPVLPYWLALGIRLFGEHIGLLKLWHFPFLLLLAFALQFLVLRFARGTERIALPLLILSPAVLPMVNLMLDIPAAALGLTALALFIRGCDRGDLKRVVLAGLIAGIAMQTKYTAMLAPAAIGWYGLTHRRLGFAVLAGGLSVLVFASWEAWLVQKYGESHFLHHLREQSSGNWLLEKSALGPGLVGNLGCFAAGFGLLIGGCLRAPRQCLAAAAILWCVGLALVLVLPLHDTILRIGSVRLSLAATLWKPTGTTVLIAAALASGRLLLVPPASRRFFGLRRSPDSWFIAGWVLVELAGYFALTPFPAGRRVIGLTLAIGILSFRCVRLLRFHPPRWMLGFALVPGLVLAAVDTWDAFPEKTLPEQEVIAVSDGRTWFAGHWGFQYYCERAGFMPIVPGRSVLEPGDSLVLPLFPDPEGFYRPHFSYSPIRPPADCLELITVLEADDALSATTIPNLYGGNLPIMGRDHPRLRIGVFKVIKRWAVPGH